MSREALERLAPILDAARAAHATIHLDTEHDELKDATYQLLREVGARYPEGPQLGCVVQAYRVDAVDDLGDLIEWSADTLVLPLQIRLVKGAYWDIETIRARGAGLEVAGVAEQGRDRRVVRSLRVDVGRQRR